MAFIAKVNCFVLTVSEKRFGINVSPIIWFELETNEHVVLIKWRKEALHGLSLTV